MDLTENRAIDLIKVSVNDSETAERDQPADTFLSDDLPGESVYRNGTAGALQAGLEGIELGKRSARGPSILSTRRIFCAGEQKS